jgi:hypothetical protein
MKLIATFLAVVMCAGAAQAATPNPDAAQVKAAHDLLASMQAEMMRMTAGMSQYASPAQRKEVMDKVIKLQPELVYSRLALPVAQAAQHRDLAADDQVLSVQLRPEDTPRYL